MTEPRGWQPLRRWLPNHYIDWRGIAVFTLIYGAALGIGWLIK